MDETTELDETTQRSIDPARFAAMQPASAAAPRRRAGEVIGSVLALVLLLVGLPVLLLVLAGVPSLPSDPPSMNELADELGAEDLVGLLVGIVWLTWLWFVACVVVEVVAARRGGLARPVPLGGPLQQVARVLVGAILLTGVVAGPAQAVTAEPAPTMTTSAALVEAQLPVVEAPPVAAEAPTSAAPYVVQPPKDGYHDNLWDIAERHLGDGRRYVEIFELNKDVVQPDGRKLELARLIQPGWELAMPADAVGLAPAAAPVAPAPPPPPSTELQADTSADATSLESIAESQGGWLAGGGLLAAGILTALLAARRRSPGRRPDDAARDAEADLRIAATSDRTARLDHVLRDLTRVCRTAGVVAPAVYAATIDDAAVELLLAPAQPDGVDGWEVHDEGRRWRRVGLPDGEPPTEVAPYPALVGLGVDLEGRDVLIDLEAAGGLVSIEGDPSVASQVASAIAVQAATAPWADVVRVAATGLPDGIDGLGGERLQVGDLETQVAALEAIDHGVDRDVLAGRLGRRGRVISHLLVSGDRPGPEFANRLGALVGAGRRAVSVVVVGEHRDARWRLGVDAHGALTVQQLGLTLTANRIGSEQVAAVAELFAASSDTDRPPAGARVPVGDPARSHDDADWATAPVRIGVLGRAVVRGREDLPAEREIMATEMVVHLALHPGGVHPTVLAGAIWPLGVPADVLSSTIERVRAWLGTDVDGTHLLRADGDGRLDLAPSVVCDWDCFRVLVLRARRATTVPDEVETLRRALALVRGPALDGAPQGRYAWAARDDFGRTVARLVADTALYLANLTRGTDPEIATGAVLTGLRVTPADQELWRLLVRVRHEGSGVAGVQQTLDEMAVGLAGVALEPETEALVTELMPAPPTLAQGS